MRTILTVVVSVLIIAGCMEENGTNDSMDHAAMDHTTSDSVPAIETSRDDVHHAGLLLQNVWGRPNFTGSNGAAYLTITNQGSADEQLIGAQSDVAKVIEIHEIKMTDNVMQMQMLADGLALPAAQQIELKPGGYHLMLVDLQRDLATGEFYTMTLHFANSGEVAVQVEVLQP